MSARLDVALLLAAAAGAPAAPASSHLAEIKLFASTMAVAKTAKTECLGIEVNDRYLEVLRQDLHVTGADYPTFVMEARAAASALRQGLTEAAHRQAWCNAAYRLYGPDGTMIRGLMRR